MVISDPEFKAYVNSFLEEIYKVCKMRSSCFSPSRGETERRKSNTRMCILEHGT